METPKSAESRAKTTPRSPACQTSPSGTDDERSPCPSASSNHSLDTNGVRRRSCEIEELPRQWGTIERTFKAFCGIKPGRRELFTWRCRGC